MTSTLRVTFLHSAGLGSIYLFRRTEDIKRSGQGRNIPGIKPLRDSERIE